MNIGIINYGVGNLGSVYRALKNLDVEPILLFFNFNLISFLDGDTSFTINDSNPPLSL